MRGDQQSEPPAVPDTAASPPAGDQDWDMAPGGPRAVDNGCCCSVLANAAYRARAEEQPFVDPGCPLHCAPRV